MTRDYFDRVILTDMIPPDDGGPLILIQAILSEATADRIIDHDAFRAVAAIPGERPMVPLKPIKAPSANAPSPS